MTRATPSRVSLTDLLRRDFRRLVDAADEVMEEVVDDAYTNWQTRYGDNERVGGPELSKRTIQRKGHDRKLEERDGSNLEALRNSLVAIKSPGTPNLNILSYTARGSVATDHWLHPIHEFGLYAPPSWGDRDLRRPTQMLMEAEVGPTLRPRALSRLLTATRSRP